MYLQDQEYFTALSKDLDVVPSIHIVGYNHLYISSSREFSAFFYSLWTQACMWYIDILMGKTLIHTYSNTVESGPLPTQLYWCSEFLMFYTQGIGLNMTLKFNSQPCVLAFFIWPVVMYLWEDHLNRSEEWKKYRLKCKKILCILLNTQLFRRKY